MYFGFSHPWAEDSNTINQGDEMNVQVGVEQLKLAGNYLSRQISITRRESSIEEITEVDTTRSLSGMLLPTYMEVLLLSRFA
jgi:hypothetical protein